MNYDKEINELVDLIDKYPEVNGYLDDISFLISSSTAYLKDDKYVFICNDIGSFKIMEQRTGRYLNMDNANQLHHLCRKYVNMFQFVVVTQFRIDYSNN